MKIWRKVLYITVPASLVVAVLVFYGWANHSETVVPQVESATTTLPNDNSKLTISTQYYSTIVAGNFRILERQVKRTNDVLDRLVAMKQVNGSSCQLAISVVNLPPDGLGGVADVHLRTSNPELYETTTVKGMEQDALAFRSTGIYELDVFMPHKDYYVSVALSNTAGGATSCDSDMQGILASWVWL